MAALRCFPHPCSGFYMIDDQKELRHALGLMVDALAAIDRAGTANESGAHLDLAICRLKERLAVNAERAQASGENALH